MQIPKKPRSTRTLVLALFCTLVLLFLMQGKQETPLEAIRRFNELAAAREIQDGALTIFTAVTSEELESNKGEEQLLNSIQSWRLLQPSPEIFVFTDSNGRSLREKIDAEAVRVFGDVPKNEYGSLIVSDIFNRASKSASSRVLVYASYSVLLGTTLTEAVHAVDSREKGYFLVVGRRCLLPSKGLVNLDISAFFVQTPSKCEPDASLHLDYLVFTKGLWPKVPDFALVGNLWQRYLVHQVLINEQFVAEASAVVKAINQNPQIASPDFHTPTFSNPIDHNAAPAAAYNQRLANERWYLGHTTLARYEILENYAILDRHQALREYTPRVAPVRPLKRGVTLAIHGTVDKFGAILQTVERWTGPVVLAFTTHTTEFPTEEYEAKFAKHKDRIVMFNFALDIKNSDAVLPVYPINTIRNIALTYVATEFVFLLDGDFVPNVGMYEHLMQNYKMLQGETNSCMTVPTFRDLTPPGRPSVVPQTKNELMSAWRGKKVEPYDEKQRPHQAVVDFDKWATAWSDYEVPYEFFYEPYCVMSMRNIPYFDNRFNYYGFDKAQHAFHLFRMGFKFKVLKDQFVVHKSHSLSPWAKKDKQGEQDWQKTWFTDLFELYMASKGGA
eukprot:comp19964_c1_seq1/m.24331 comp19964_c1_seq1/g.24331  ORF comp19964_c1_seq1/g.24331 comp19964_c1_seq1/m.24331 type:complete len:614 (-) comp19964_c1_seq1:338-2179(-)